MIPVIFQCGCQNYCLIKVLKPIYFILTLKIRAKFDETCLKQERLTFTHKNLLSC